MAGERTCDNFSWHLILYPHSFTHSTHTYREREKKNRKKKNKTKKKRKRRRCERAWKAQPRLREATIEAWESLGSLRKR